MADGDPAGQQMAVLVGSNRLDQDPDQAELGGVDRALRDDVDFFVDCAGPELKTVVSFIEADPGEQDPVLACRGQGASAHGHSPEGDFSRYDAVVRDRQVRRSGKRL